MIKQEMAFQIFLKRMPLDQLHDKTRDGYVSVAKQAMEVAELFLSTTTPPIVVPAALYEEQLELPFPESDL